MLKFVFGSDSAQTRWAATISVAKFPWDRTSSILCVKAQLVVEVDGSQHQPALSRDEERTAWLRSRGFRVLRFWNNDILQQTESVLEKIRIVLLEPPP